MQEETNLAWESKWACLDILLSLQIQAESLPDIESKIKLALTGLAKLPASLLPLFPTNRKSNKKSSVLRLKIDRDFEMNIRDEDTLLNAWELYCKSIAYAEPGSVELGLAYASRSACLFHLDKIEECVRDVNRALELPYPEHLKPNLLRRKLKCLRLLGNQEADKVCQEAHLLLERMTLDDAKKDQMKKAIDEAAKVAENPQFKNILLDLPSFVSHKDIPSVSQALDLIYNENLGRHFVANRDIRPGEILIAEKPYAQHLFPLYQYTHCSHCLVRAWDGIPCDNCTNTMYCSQKCMNDAWKQYHDVECVLKEFYSKIDLQDMFFERGPFSLRMTVKAIREFKSIKEITNEFDKINKCKDYVKKCYSDDGIFHSNQYRPVYNLLTHETEKESYEVLILIINTAVILSYINIYTDFFKTTDKNISALCQNENAILFGKLFVQNYFKIETNAHEFVELKLTEPLKIGSTLSCATSFLNHSCNPNTFKCPIIKNNTVQLVICALKPISKGSPIFDNYGCNFLHQSKNLRQEYLKSCYFECRCKACNQNWPELKDLPSIKSQLYKSGERTNEAFLTAQMIYSQWQNIICSSDYHSIENASTIIKPLTHCIAILSETIKEPTQEYYEILDFYSLAFVKLYGNNFKL